MNRGIVSLQTLNQIGVGGNIKYECVNCLTAFTETRKAPSFEVASFRSSDSLTGVRSTTVFKTVAFVHSAIPPYGGQLRQYRYENALRPEIGGRSFYPLQPVISKTSPKGSNIHRPLHLEPFFRKTIHPLNRIFRRRPQCPGQPFRGLLHS